MENEIKEPSYYGVIPASVRYDKELTPNAKILYAEISALANMRGICWATNKTLAKLYDVQPTRISEWVRQLEARGYIRTKTIEGGFRGISVLIDRSGKAEPPLLEKQKHNNTVINNHSIVELQKQLLQIVNEVTGRNFRTLPDRGVKKTLDAFSLVEIRSALTALAADPWHRPKLKEFKIDYLIRSTTIDKFIGQIPAHVSNAKGDVIEEDEEGSHYVNGEKVTIENQDEMVRKFMGGGKNVDN